jgi:hypothetical protein
LTRGYRPPFEFPGAWLYKGGDETEFGTVHIIGVDPDNPDGLKADLGDKALPAAGTGTVDHIAFLATGVEDMRKTLQTGQPKTIARAVPYASMQQHKKAQRDMSCFEDQFARPERHRPGKAPQASNLR